MRNFRIATLLLTVLLIMAGVTSADQQNKKTVFTFKDSVQVPGQVLPAGTYVFKLANSDANRHIVQIYNQDETKLITTILAVPNYQLTPSGETIITYAKAPANQPVALEAWFYPGDNFGQQFAYPEAVASELTTLNTIKVPSTGSEQAYPSSTSDTTSASASSSSTTTPSSSAASSSSAPSTTAPATSDSMTSTTTTTTTTATATAPATSSDTMSSTKRTDDTTPANRMANTPSATSTETSNMNRSTETPATQSSSDTSAQSSERSSQNLPQTASQLPLAGLIGFLAIGAAAALRKITL
ncbi:MAG TPA: hypothetical protein VOA41_08845 [Candidatus Dormibacteraeota bacterium]|nr:hypothetical protein [Candidatus Dormibacteraeota bacterium]